MRYLRIAGFLLAVSSGAACLEHKPSADAGVSPGAGTADAGTDHRPEGDHDGGFAWHPVPATSLGGHRIHPSGSPDASEPAMTAQDAGTLCAPLTRQPGQAISTGDPMPDCVGVVAGLEVPVIDGDGTIAFVARASGNMVSPRNEHAVLNGSSDQVVVLSREGDPVPGGNFTAVLGPVSSDRGGPFRSVPQIADDGRVAIVTAFSASSTTTRSVGAMILSDYPIALDADHVSDVPGATFDMPFSGHLGLTFAFGIDSSYAFVDQVSKAGDKKRAGLFAGKAGTLSKIALAGELAPGGAKFAGLGNDATSFFPPAIGPSGNIVFVATVKVSTATVATATVATATTARPERNDALFRKMSGGALERLIATDQSVMSAGGTTAIIAEIGDSSRPPSTNTNGDVALALRLRGGDRGIVVVRAGGALLAAKEGDTAPGGDVYRELRWQPAINDLGQIAFVAGVAAAPGSGRIDGQALFAGAPEDLKLIARSGDPTPDGSGVFKLFAGVPNSDQAPFQTSTAFHLLAGDLPNLNQHGDLAFLAEVESGAGDNRVGLYLQSGATLTKVIGQGDNVGGRTVTDIGFQSVMSAGARGLNDLCEVTYATVHDDQSLSVWVANPCMRGD